MMKELQRKLTIFMVFIINWQITYQMGANFEEHMIEDSSAKNRGARYRRSSPSSIAVHWPKAVIPFRKHENLNPELGDHMDSAMAYLEKNSCLKFIDVADIENLSSLKLGHTRHVIVEQHPSVCGTQIGKGSRNEGSFPIWMSDDCAKHSMAPSVHELLHVSGIRHEQIRPDRDQYLTLHEENLQQSMIFQYDKDPLINTTITRYDISSLMHYHPRSGLKSEALANENHSMTLKHNATILIRKNIYGGSTPAIGPGDMRDENHPMSHRDIAGLNNFYNCAGSCDVQLDCQNGGYQDKNCKCQCPKHFKGKTCEEFIDNKNSKECGKSILSATDAWTTLTPPRKNGNNFKFNKYCTWLIEAPADSMVGMKMTKMFLDTKEGIRNRQDGECNPKYNEYGNDILHIYLYGTDIDYYPISCEDREHYLRKVSLSDTNKLVVEWKSDVKYKTHFGIQTDQKQDVANNPGWKLKYRRFNEDEIKAANNPSDISSTTGPPTTTDPLQEMHQDVETWLEEKPEDKIEKQGGIFKTIHDLLFDDPLISIEAQL